MARTHSRSDSEKLPEGNDFDNRPEISAEVNDIVPPLSPIKSLHRRPSLNESINAPPSFAESQFATIVRRQRPRDTALKISNVPTRYPNLTQDFEFAGWGSMSYLDLTDEDLYAAQKELNHTGPKLGQWRATAVAGNDVVGSIFYCFAAILPAAGIYSIISLFISGLLLNVFRPILRENASAVPYNGGSYSYLVNFTSKNIAIIAAAITSLDAITTAVVSAGSAGGYLAGEVHLPFSDALLPVFILILFSGVCMLGIRESSGVALTIISFHFVTMVVLAIASIVRWGINGNSLLAANWAAAQPGSAGKIALQIFYGVSLGFLGNTGFELTVTYVEEVHPKTFPKILRNLWLLSFIQLTLMMLLVWAVVPYGDVQSHSGNILSLLAEHAAGAKWLRYWLVTDAVLVLCAGVLTGIISSCSSIERLARDHILPALFLRRMKSTDAPYISIIIFAVIGLAMYGVVDTSLTILSGQFAVSFIAVMGLFALSNLLLKFNRDRLVRTPRVGLPVVIFAFIILCVAVAGNIVMSPVIVGYFAIFFIVAVLAMTYTGSRGKLATVLYWIYNRNRRLHSWKWTRDWHLKLIEQIRRYKKQPIIFFAKTDEISVLNKAIQYINRNECTSLIKLVHFYHRIEDIPSEFESNYRILDEIYPSVTIELVFVQAEFNPKSVVAVSKKLGVPTSLCFIQCPGEGFGWGLGDLRGVRIIML